MNKLKFGSAAIIGAGKIAYSLLPAIKNAGINVSQIISRNIDSAEKLAFENNVYRFSDSVKSLDDDATLVFLSLPDSQIKPVTDSISKSGLEFTDKLFVHLSGSKDIYEMDSLKAKGAYIASLHIMNSFPSRSPIEFKGFPAAIETDNNDIYKFLYKLCGKMNLNPFRLSSGVKVYYHLMGVFTLNNLSANFDNAERLRRKTNNSIPEVSDLLYNVVFAKLKDIYEQGAIESLSGPVERGDLSTIQQHIESIKEDKLLSLNYIISTLTLLEIALKKKSVSEEQYSEFKNFLNDKLKAAYNNYFK